MQEEIKTIPEISNLYIVGGQEESISIRVDPLLLEAKNIDLLQLTQALQKNNMALPGGKIDFQNNQGYISVNGKLDTINKVKQLTIANYLGAPVHVEDVAIVELAPAEYRSQTWYADHNTISGEYNDAIFLGIAKKK